jgi:hypothetical protein
MDRHSLTINARNWERESPQKLASLDMLWDYHLALAGLFIASNDIGGIRGGDCRRRLLKEGD